MVGKKYKVLFSMLNSVKSYFSVFCVILYPSSYVSMNTTENNRVTHILNVNSEQEMINSQMSTSLKNEYVHLFSTLSGMLN